MLETENLEMLEALGIQLLSPLADSIGPVLREKKSLRKENKRMRSKESEYAQQMQSVQE